MGSRIHYQLHCKWCGFTSGRSQAQLLETLWQQKMLRRASDPDPQLLDELFKAAASKLNCENCQHIGLLVELADDDVEDWGDLRPCEVCGQRISVERLEVFPATKRCVKCQAKRDDGGKEEVPEYCPRCGGLLQLRSSRGAGLARYEMHCAECGHRG